MFASLLACGVDYGTAARMGFSRAAWLIAAKNEMSKPREDDGVRDATQADIQRFMCG